MQRKTTDFDKIWDNKDNAFFIHYSCENLNDSNSELTPRVTSIAVLNLGKNQSKSFSIHLSAEVLEITKDKVKDHYQALERHLLEQFNKFVQTNVNSSFWIHWNMDDMTYGFSLLEHRYNVLTHKNICVIPDTNKFNLSKLLESKYGKDYVSHPRLQKLMELNKDKPRDFLSGEEEVLAFKNGEYVKMHKSTLCKVYYFKSIFTRVLKNKLKTENHNFSYFVTEIFEKCIVRVISIICTIYTFVGIIVRFYNFFNKSIK